MKVLLITFILFSSLAQASVSNAKRVYDQRGRLNYLKVANELMKDGLYFASVPFVKEYLVSRSRVNGAALDKIMDKIITEVGVKQFEVMPTRSLQKINSSLVKYILAKKYFRTGKYESALREVQRSISSNHPIKPFALLIEGTSYSILRKYKEAVTTFNQCIDKSEYWLAREKDKDKIQQLEVNRDYCTVGIARTKFANRDHDQANLDYLDLPKSSYVWPEILFEEAWNSFYQRDYNRALGKLVTYKAPVLDFVFNPEIEVIRSMSYLHLCLFNDAKGVVDDFYRTYSKDSKYLSRYIRRYKKNYKHYYNLGMNPYAEGIKGNNTFIAILNDIRKDAAFKEMKKSYFEGKKEYQKLKRLRKSRFSRAVLKSLRSALNLQRNLIGAYVRKRVRIYTNQLAKSFKAMSYIKLEILSWKKALLYNPKAEVGRTRGDVRNLSRNEKQYFWTFNGEFWADELGDYVFALKSECEK